MAGGFYSEPPSSFSTTAVQGDRQHAYHHRRHRDRQASEQFNPVQFSASVGVLAASDSSSCPLPALAQHDDLTLSRHKDG